MNPKNKQIVMTKFSFKSSIVVFLSGITGGVVIPYLFYLIHLEPKIAVMLFLPALLAFSIAYSQCFIETKSGFGKRFYLNLVIAFVVFEIASYFWLFKGVIF